MSQFVISIFHCRRVDRIALSRLTLSRLPAGRAWIFRSPYLILLVAQKCEKRITAIDEDHAQILVKRRRRVPCPRNYYHGHGPRGHVHYVLLVTVGYAVHTK